MDDLISRTAAIRTFTGKPPEYYSTDYIASELRDLLAVEAIPVVHARWVYEDDDPVMMPCSGCGYLVYRYNNTRYCPHCGAKMDG